MSVYVVRAFVRLRELLASNHELAKHLDQLEARIQKKLTAHNDAIAAILSAIRELMNPPTPARRPIGFTADLGCACVKTGWRFPESRSTFGLRQQVVGRCVLECIPRNFRQIVRPFLKGLALLLDVGSLDSLAGLLRTRSAISILTPNLASPVRPGRRRSCGVKAATPCFLNRLRHRATLRVMYFGSAGADLYVAVSFSVIHSFQGPADSSCVVDRSVGAEPRTFSRVRLASERHPHAIPPA